MRIAGWMLVGIVGCTDTEGDPLQLAKRAHTVCPRVDVERLEGDWVQLVGAAATGEIRVRFVPTPDGYVGYHVDHLDREVWTGTRDGRSVRFTAGDRAWRLVPSLETCSLVVTPLGPGDEPAGDVVELLELPDLGVTFAYAPPTEALTVDGDPAALPAGDVTAWIDAPADPECAATAEAWLDGVRVAADLAVADPEPDAAARRWTWTWPRLGPGEHLLELTRVATCPPDGERRELGTAGARVVVTAVH